jgi:hypothetical protein
MKKIMLVVCSILVFSSFVHASEQVKNEINTGPCEEIGSDIKSCKFTKPFWTTESKDYQVRGWKNNKPFDSLYTLFGIHYLGQSPQLKKTLDDAYQISYLESFYAHELTDQDRERLEVHIQDQLGLNINIPTQEWGEAMRALLNLRFQMAIKDKRQTTVIDADDFDPN